MTESDLENSAGSEEKPDLKQLKEDTEHWLIRQGLPHLVENFRSSRDIITSATPAFIVVFFIEIFFLEFDLLFTDRYHGGIQFAILVGSAATLLLVIMGVNKLRGRRLLQLPERLGFLELGVFLLLPSILAGVDRGFLWSFFWVLLLNLVLSVVLYLFASYAVIPMLRWGLTFMFRQLRQVLMLTARSLPLLLLISFFVFLNAEMWQVANDFKIGHYLAIIGLILGVGFLFFSFSIPSEARSLWGFDSWEDVVSQASKSGAPLVSYPSFLEESAKDEDWQPEDFTSIRRAAKFNLEMLLFFSAFVRVIIVGCSIGVFFMVVGLLAVGDDTIIQWTTNTTVDELDILLRFSFLGDEVIVTKELLFTSGLISALSCLQFALVSITNDLYKQQFFQDIADEVRMALAVRELYIRRLSH